MICWVIIAQINPKSVKKFNFSLTNKIIIMQLIHVGVLFSGFAEISYLVQKKIEEAMILAKILMLHYSINKVKISRTYSMLVEAKFKTKNGTMLWKSFWVYLRQLMWFGHSIQKSKNGVSLVNLHNLEMLALIIIEKNMNLVFIII